MQINYLDPVPSLFLATVLLMGAAWDLRFHKIPNWLTFPAAAVAIIYHTILNGFSGFLFSLEGIAVGIAILLPFYLLGGMGAGDAKLLGAVGGLLGPKGVFFAFLFTALVGGIYALVLLTYHGYLKKAVLRYGIMLKTFFLTKNFMYIPPPPAEKKPKLWYGLAIAAGILISIGWGNYIL